MSLTTILPYANFTPLRRSYLTCQSTETHGIELFRKVNLLLFAVDFTKVDDVNNLNTGGNIGDEPAGAAPSNIRTHTLEDFSDG